MAPRRSARLSASPAPAELEPPTPSSRRAGSARRSTRAPTLDAATEEEEEEDDASEVQSIASPPPPRRGKAATAAAALTPDPVAEVEEEEEDGELLIATLPSPAALPPPPRMSNAADDEAASTLRIRRASKSRRGHAGSALVSINSTPSATPPRTQTSSPAPPSSTTSAGVTKQSKAAARRAKLLALFAPLARKAHFLPPLLILASLVLLVCLPSPTPPFIRKTYVDENALQPGAGDVRWDWTQVEWADKIAARVGNASELNSLARAKFAAAELRAAGLAASVQTYTFTLPSGRQLTGANAYGNLRAARADGREAILIAAPWRSRWSGADASSSQAPPSQQPEGAPTAYERATQRALNVRGIATTLTLAKWLAQSNYWSKDFIFVISDGELEGMQAWASAYYGRIQSNLAADALQLARAQIWNGFALDYPADSFASVQVLHEGLDGSAPNMDALNALVQIAQQTENVPVHLDAPAWAPPETEHALGALGKLLEEKSWGHGGVGKFLAGWRNIASQMARAAAGHPSGVHGLLHRFHIDAFTIFAVPAPGPYGFLHLGKITESLVRSFSNLLERLHHSQYFYLLTDPFRFVQIGTFLPVALLPSLALTFRGLAIWQAEGRLALSRGVALASTSGLESTDDTPLRKPTQAQLFDSLVKGALARGSMLSPARLAALRRALDVRGRPVVAALVVVLLANVVGAASFFMATKVPVDCAAQGLLACKEMQGVLALAVGAVPLIALFAARVMRASITDAGGLLAVTTTEQRRGRALALARTLQAFTLLNAGMLTAAVCTLNFSLAALTALLFAVPLVNLHLPASPSDSSSANSTSSLARIWTLLGSFTLLVLHPAALLMLLASFSEACDRSLLPALPPSLRPLLVGLGVQGKACPDISLARRLLDGALWDYHVLGSSTLPFALLAYTPVVLQSAVAVGVAALA